MFQIQEVAITDITIPEDRQRRDLGDLTELKFSITESGILNPVLVDEHYELVAGERRIRACAELGLATIPARIMPGLSPEDKLMIEFFENIGRKQLHWSEELQGRARFHEYWKQAHSQWGYRETAKRLGVSLGGLSSDLELAAAMKILPELGTETSKGRAREAYRRMQNEAQAITAMESAPPEERAKLDNMLKHHSGTQPIETELGPDGEAAPDGSPISDRSTMNRPSGGAATSEAAAPQLPQCLYQVCSFEATLDRLPAAMVGFCEIDPPYAINFDSVYTKASDGTSQEEDWSVGDLYTNMTYLLKHLYDKLMPGSWVLCWLGGEHEDFMQQTALDYGYTIQQPGFWTKPGGSCNTPDRVMIHNYEKYLLLRKGDARFQTDSLKAAIEFAPVPSAQRYHQWQKPEALYRHFFRALARSGTLFFSPFAGSGMSMIISTFFGMIPIGADISQKYYYQFYARLREMCYEADTTSQGDRAIDNIIA